MITVITGLPGAGKTSNTLHRFLQVEGRPKYANFIKDFDYNKHNVVLLEKFSDWQLLPDNSLVFIDEAQQYLRPRGPKDKVPDWIAAFETHRHRGFDFWLTTQNPMLLDVHVRRLTQEHLHYFRPFGLKTVSLLKWEECKDDPRDPRAIEVATKERVKLPAAVFNEYTSTVVDTHKARIPKKLVFGLALVAFFAVTAVFYGLKTYSSVNDNVNKTKQLTAPVNTSVFTPSSESFSHEKKPLTAADFQPVTDVAPWTAPVYQEIAKPTNFPKFSGCMMSSTRGCTCFTQQGTKLFVPQDYCQRVIVDNDMPFNPFKNDSEQFQQQNSSQIASNRP